MSVCTQGCRRVLLASALGLGLGLPAAALAQCPAPELMSERIEKVFKSSGIEVKRVQPAAVKGLCEVQVVLQRRGSLLYTDTTGAHFIVNGIMIDSQSGKNLTEQSLVALNAELEALNVISPEDMKQVDALVAMTVGTKGPAVYFVTDPL